MQNMNRKYTKQNILIIFLVLFFLTMCKAYAQIQTTDTFNIQILTGTSLQIQSKVNPNLFLTLTVQSGTLNGTGTLGMTEEGAGTLRIWHSSNVTVAVNASEDIAYSVNGVDGVKGFAASPSSVTVIQWSLRGYSIPLDTYIMVGMGLFGLFGLVFAPVYMVAKFKSGDWSSGLCWGVLLFIIGIGCVIVWLWS
jgi:hypothetical protein